MTGITGEQSDEWFEHEFAASRVLLILRGLGLERSLALARSAWDAGITSVEVPLQSPADIECLRAMSTEARGRGYSVGAGTVVDPAQIALAADAGAAYTVSPGTDDDVIAASLHAGLPTLPGAATPSDIQRCRRLGLAWVKAFPAAQLTPGWIAAVRAPFPELQVVATGGVSATNARDFLAAGARVVSFGSALGETGQLERVADIARRPRADV
jgi:Entner-Doudoroff aldolase